MFKEYKHYYLIFSFAIVIVTAFFFVFSTKYSLASWDGSDYDTYDTDLTAYYDLGYAGGSFSFHLKPDATSTLTYIGMRLSGSGACAGANVRLWAGGTNYSDWQPLPATSQLVLFENFSATTTLNPYTATQFMIIDDKPWCYEYDAFTDAPILHVYGGLTNPYYDGAYINWSNASLPFFYTNLSVTQPDEVLIGTAEDWGLPSDYDFVQIGSQYLTLKDSKCEENLACDLVLDYTFDLVGYDVNIYEYSYVTATSTFYASSTLGDIMVLRKKFEISAESAGTKKYFRAVVQNSEKSTSRIATMAWYDLDDLIDGEYNINSACSDMATTTWEFTNPTSWAGGMGYAMECSFRKGIYWAFTAKPSTYLKLENAKDDILGEFPFNIFTFISAVASSTKQNATTTWELAVPWQMDSSTIATFTMSQLDVEENYPGWFEKIMYFQALIFYTVGFLFVFKAGLYILKIDFFNQKPDDN